MQFETIFQINQTLWPLAVLAFLRIASVLIWLPIFGDSAVPRRVRVLLALVFTIALWPTIEAQMEVSMSGFNWTPANLAVLTVMEIFFGFAVGFASRTVIYGIQICAQVVGISMGFQASSLFSPATDSQESAFASFQGWIVVIVLLTLNLHHIFIEGIVKSFATYSFGQEMNALGLAQAGIGIVTQSFELALKFAGPLIAIQFLSNLGLGFLNRAVPQLNVFAVSFPLGFTVGMIVLFLSMAAFIRTVASVGLHAEVGALDSIRRMMVK